MPMVTELSEMTSSCRLLSDDEVINWLLEDG